MTNDLSRRKFLQITGTAAAAAALTGPKVASAESSSPDAPLPEGNAAVDVCVVGAGFGGLAAAHAIRAAGGSVVVLEARDRVGGRTLTIPLADGGWIDEGGQWVGAGHDRFYHWIKATGKQTYPSPHAGESLVFGPAERKYTRVGDDWMAVPGMNRVEAVKERLQAMADQLDSRQPWSHPEARKWDAITMAGWLAANVPEDNIREFLVGDMSYACASPEQISLLSFLSLIRACVSFDKLNGFDDAAQQDRVVGGTQPVAKRMAEMLGGNRVRLKQAVRRVHWNTHGATVHTDTLAIEARHVIFAGPPTLM
ncbi:MAG TPA: FAD-dependent oxidoreductase, partial [Gemmatimonas sp.]|nr:FAD-dependent oxidoreductase [Gemmatimonas sp.]